MLKVYRCSVAVLLLGNFVTLAWKPLDVASAFWAHAAVGREIAEHGIPRQTLFLWTATIPWVYHSWLTQLAFYELTRLPAFPYVVAGLVVALAIAPFAGALWVWTRRARDSSWVAVALVLVLQGLSARFEARPELFSNLFLFLLMLFVTLWRESPARSGWWLLVALAGFALWANLHGAVALGLVVLAATAVCDAVQDGASPSTRRLALLAILAPVAVCLNPYGLGYWRAFQPINSFTLGSYIEWTPIYTGPRLPAESQLVAVVAGGLAVLAWSLSPRRRAAELAWLLLFGGLFVMQRRNIGPFTVACLTVAALNAAAIDTQAWWARLTRGRGSPGGPPFRWEARVAIVACLLVKAYLLLPTWRGAVPLLPVRADAGLVRFLREHRGELHGQVFNDQEVSGYLEWRFRGELPLYIDRMDAFPDWVTRHYLAVISCGPESRALLAQVDVVIFGVERPGPPLVAPARKLDRSPNWARVYAGSDAVVWVRRAKHGDLIAACPGVSDADFATLLGRPTLRIDGGLDAGNTPSAEPQRPPDGDY
jgi:hypothetical protein